MVRCANCGYAGTESMRFCPRCGTRLWEKVRGGYEPHISLVAGAEASGEVCLVEYWRGYIKCDFVALDVQTNAEIARSPLFSWRHHDPPPREGRALTAFQRLVERLDALGWEPVGPRPSPWYAQRFVRHGEGFAEERGGLGVEPLTELERPDAKRESGEIGEGA
jgi:hypothetical protein